MENAETSLANKSSAIKFDDLKFDRKTLHVVLQMILKIWDHDLRNYCLDGILCEPIIKAFSSITLIFKLS